VNVTQPATGDQTRVVFADTIDHFIRGIGRIVCWANAALIAVIITQVVLRYGFGAGKVALEELQWHLYAFAVMIGVSYAQATNSHIRVDVIASRLSPRAIGYWEVFGILVFALPFVGVVFIHSLDFLAESWRLGERSDAPMGLPWRWVIKSVIPISFGLLGLALVSRLVRELARLIRKD
jgi:TRAP-type mannitol/chloroaromatic compound transport system permease small subunit